MRRTSLLALSIAVLGTVAISFVVGDLARAASRERRFFSARHGVGVEAPVGWSLSRHTGYPDILVVLVHPSGGRISLSAAPTPVIDAQALASQSRRGLEAQRLTIDRVGPGARGGVQLEAHNARGESLRQLYVVRPLGAGTRQGVVLTLVARTDGLAAAAAAFDWSIAHLALETPTGAPDPREAEASAATPDAGVAPSAPQRAGSERDR